MNAPSAHVLTPLPYRVLQTADETPDTFTMELEPVGGKNGFSFGPGQFNMLYAFGVGEVPISISGDPTDGHPLIHTVRAVGAVTQAMRKLKRDALLGVRGPFGSSWPVEEARGRDVVIVAGGIGLAPLRPAIYHVLAHRKDYRKLILLYGARNPEELLYRDELQEWRARSDMEVGVTVDRADATWKGMVGVVTHLIGPASFDPQNTMTMVCGPEIMMRFAIIALQQRGVADKDIYVSLERNMKCGVGLCGHCQFGPTFICKDGPVYAYDAMRDWLRKREI